MSFGRHKTFHMGLLLAVLIVAFWLMCTNELSQVPKIPDYGPAQRIEYFSGAESDDEFGSGVAAYKQGEAEKSFAIDAYLHSAFYEFKLDDEFEKLPSNAPCGWGPYEEPALHRDGLLRAACILRERAMALREDQMDFVVCIGVTPRVDYRIRCDLESLRSNLQKLAAFLEEAHQAGSGVQFIM